MTELIEDKIVDADYAFRFDALPEPVTFSRQIKITGWLLHRQGLPIHGIRGIVRGFLQTPIDFQGTPQKIATTDSGCLPGFAGSRAKRFSSGARSPCRTKRNHVPGPG